MFVCTREERKPLLAMLFSHCSRRMIGHTALGGAGQARGFYAQNDLDRCSLFFVFGLVCVAGTRGFDARSAGANHCKS